MDIPAILITLMFLTLFGLLLLGYPVAFTLGGVALFFAIAGLILANVFGLPVGVLDYGYIALFPDRIFGIVMNDVLLAVPLFIAMGVMLEKSCVAEDLLEAMGQLFGAIRGGLGISVTVVGALLAASTGIVGATVVTMGLLSLPTMLKRGYDPGLASGSIAAAGTLGQIIPPSIVLVLLGDVLSSSYQEAQRNLGIFSPTPMSVGDLFAGALLPGLGLVMLYILYQAGMAIFRPASSPAIPRAEGTVLNIAFYGKALRALIPPIALIIAVLGSILSGIATPTEAAAVGAVGAILLGGLRCVPEKARLVRVSVIALMLLFMIGQLFDLRFGREDIRAVERAAQGAAILLTIIFFAGLFSALRNTWRSGVLKEVMTSTVKISTMVYTILIGAALFSLVFRGLGGDAIIEAALTNLPGGKIGALILVMLVMFVLGFFLDFIEIIFVVVPIVAPVLLMMDISPVWLGVMMAINLQTSFLTPPFGFALFYLRGVAPDSLKTVQIYKGVAPFVLIQLTALVLLALFPGLATWLPGVIFGL